MFASAYVPLARRFVAQRGSPAWIEAARLCLRARRSACRRSQHPASPGPDEWINLRIDIDDTLLSVAVNQTEALTLTETKAVPAAGNIGLFVDIGSESFFSNLRVTPH